MDHCTSIDDERVAKINDNTKLKDPSTDIIHAKKLCRLCAHRTDKVTLIFGEPGLEQHLAGKINAYLPVTVNKSDVLPKQLCINCINKLQIISDFAENCLKAEEQLKRNMEPKILKSRSIKSDVTLLNNNMINMDKAVPQSFNDSTEVFTENYKPMLLMSNNSILPCPLCCDGKMTMTYQKSDKVTENSYREKFGSNIHLGENVEKTKIASSSSFNNSIELLDSNNESEIQCDLSNTNEMWESKIVDVTSIDFQDENTSTDLTAHACHNENIRENKKNESNKESNIVLCQICNKTFPSTETCIDHCKGHFPSQKTCHICHFQFDCEDHWLDHIRQHILNTHLQVHDHFLCQDCNQLFETLAAFSVHACPYKQYEKCDNVDEIVEETSDTFPCDTNSNGFQTIVTDNKKYIVPEELASSVKIQSKGKLSCQYCMGSFSEKSDFTSHMQTAHPDSTPQYACEICDEKFQNQFVLQYHYASHVNLSSLQCVFCSLTFTTQTSLQQHLLSQHPKLIPLQPCYKCNTCHETYTNLNDSVTHISTHLPNNYEQNHEIEEVHISQLYMCEYCESCFMVKSLLYQHYFTHSKDSRYVCKTCNSTFTSYGRLSKHKSLHNEQNKSNVTNSADILTVVKLFVCQECEKCYTQWNSLNNHRRNCHQNTHSYTCKICHESFNLYAEYQDHRKIHPAQVKTESEVFEKEYLCDYCQKTFHHHSTLALHQRIHLKGQPYTCEICGETFRLKSTYNKHFLKHTGVKPYICDVCGKGFTQNSGLYTHRRVHTGEKPYACDLCGKKFRLKHDRDNHRRCHTGERPYQCTYCGKAFRTSHDHRQHLLIHTGQRPYRCDYCSKGFRRINGLNVHKRIHTGEKPYGCAICGRHFTQKGDMMKHCKTQHGNTF